MSTTTLLDVVQEVLSSIDADDVNTITDTVEADQVVSIARSVYRNMTSNRDWPFFKRALQLSNSGDSEKPTHMILDDEVKELLFINYDTAELDATRKNYTEMHWLNPDDFLRRANKLSDASDNVMVVTDSSGIEIPVRTDTAPKYYTSFNDQDVVFDSYNSEVDSTIKSF